jgi:ParB family transcriptional regulator, chromosome partitioning protein
LELQVKKAKANGVRTKQVGFERPCEKMTEAIVMDGGKRGQITKVCADLSCRVHHPDTPSPQQIERQRAEERKRIEKEKIAITVRHRILAALLERVSVPLKKADLLTIAEHVLITVPYNRLPLLAKRHKVELEKSGIAPAELLLKQIFRYDESDVCRFLLESSLLESAYRSGGNDPDSDVLLTTAKRYRIDVEKLQKAVTQEFAAKKKIKEKKPAPDKSAA